MLKTRIITICMPIISAALLAGCQSSNLDSRVADNLSARWHGRSLADFQAKFGSPQGGGSELVWKSTRQDIVPAQEKSLGFGINGVILATPVRQQVAAHPEDRTCVIGVSAANGTITRVRIILDASTPQAGSYCMQVYG